MEFTGAYFGEGSGPMHYDHVVCSGTEYNLTECVTGTEARESSHEDDVGVKCNTSIKRNCFCFCMVSFFLHLSVDDSYRNGDVRLVGGPHNWEGRVEIFINGAWGTIGYTSLNSYEAQLICNQLGLSAESKVERYL